MKRKVTNSMPLALVRLHTIDEFGIEEGKASKKILKNIKLFIVVYSMRFPMENNLIEVHQKQMVCWSDFDVFRRELSIKVANILWVSLKYVKNGNHQIRSIIKLPSKLLGSQF